MKDYVELSLAKSSYPNGKVRFEPLLNEEDGYMWLQFVDGCGYDIPATVTAQEAREIAALLIKFADDLDNKS